MRRDFLFQADEIGVPVGLQFVDVKAGIDVERQLQRAGGPLVGAQLAQARLAFPLLVAAYGGVLELVLELVQVCRVEFVGGEQDQFDAGLAGGLEEHLVIGIAIHVPEDDGQFSSPPGLP